MPSCAKACVCADVCLPPGLDGLNISPKKLPAPCKKLPTPVLASPYPPKAYKSGSSKNIFETSEKASPTQFATSPTIGILSKKSNIFYFPYGPNSVFIVLLRILFVAVCNEFCNKVPK